ncbi:NUC188 domain-containing protein [Infundibulicybe gibba]|nr:NUC188 domain-containing protein [Infundibulicybe gibba]
MPPKRKGLNDSDGPTAREKKKLKMNVVRTIAVQPITGAKDLDVGPSKLQTRHLPNAIDVEKFSESRAFEINAMQAAMKATSASSTQRAWQALPRHLRRRAASHDVRRVPLRLRDKARAEMDPLRTKPSSHSVPRLGKGRRINRTDSFLRRQCDKQWLETHLWHAKRMIMENIWGFRLAVRPTEKAFRPSHRAAVHGSILHDSSYFSLIEIRGLEKHLSATLETCCDPQGQGPGAVRYLAGSRTLETHIYQPRVYPFGLVSPVTIIWQPAPTTTRSATKTRAVWLRVHPAAHDQVFSILQSSALLVLESVKQTPEQDITPNIDIIDLRGQVNSFEIMGPKASQVIRGALHPIVGDKREEFTKFWSSLGDLQTTASIPRGMVVGLCKMPSTTDTCPNHFPRFPPKNTKSRPSPHELTPNFPTSTLARSEIWDKDLRSHLLKPRFTKQHWTNADLRYNPIPGTPLDPLRQDDRIPVLLIQRSLESMASNACSNSESQGMHGWTLIIPAGWSMPFFSSLTFTGTRVGGQRERQTQSFEAGVPYFPRDYPFTSAYEEYSEKRATEERGLWERKPPAKRTNFEKMGTRSPWRADWDTILGIPLGPSDENIYPLLQHNIRTMLNPGAGLIDEISRLRLKRRQDPLPPILKADNLLKGAVVNVRVTMCRRGTPDDLANIYLLGLEEAKRWLVLFGKQKNRMDTEAEESRAETELSSLKPSQESMIGYVTTGHFSLSRGDGFAIAAIPLTRLLELYQQTAKLGMTDKNPQLLVKIRNRDANICRGAYLEPIS